MNILEFKGMRGYQTAYGNKAKKTSNIENLVIIIIEKDPNKIVASRREHEHSNLPVFCS